MYSEYGRNSNEKDPKKKKKTWQRNGVNVFKKIQINQWVNRRVNLSIYK